MSNRKASRPTPTQEGVLVGIIRKKPRKKAIITGSGAKVYACYLESCGRQFSDLTAVRKHERIHLNEKPYICSICGLSFVQRSNCQKHEKSHTGVKEYACDRCPKKFTSTYSLRQHLEIHTQASENAKYACPGCNKSYTYFTSLLKHQKGCSKKPVASQDDRKDSLKENSEEEIPLKKIIKSELKLEEKFNYFDLKEENNELNLKSESCEPKIESYAFYTGTLMECKAEANKLEHALDSSELQNDASFLQSTKLLDEELPALNQNSNMPTEVKSQVRTDIAAPAYQTSINRESDNKPLVADNLPSLQPSQRAKSGQVANTLARVTFLKQLEEVLSFRKFLLYETLLTSGELATFQQAHN